jgi:ubiquinone/menaquinone biosynthesis C-methylase UbiE
MARALSVFAPTGEVLELACGTGWWTERLAQRATRILCVDASAEVLARNRARLQSAGLSLPEYLQADLFSWEPRHRYDVVFFSFWLSHVPKDRFDSFWNMVANALKPDGRVFLIDSLAAPSSTAADQSTRTSGDIQKRLLNDGESYRVVKLYYQPSRLAHELARLGWESQIQATATHFLYGPAAIAAMAGRAP